MIRDLTNMKSKIFPACCLRKFSIEWDFEFCWNLLAWRTSYSLDIVLSIFKGNNPTCVILFRNILMLTWSQTFTDAFLSNSVWWHSSLSSTLISDWMNFDKSELYEKLRTSLSFFFDLDEIHCVITARWFVESHAHFVLYKIQGREPCGRYLIKYTFLQALSIYMMLNTNKLFSLIPIWMTLMFTQGHRVTKKLQLVQLFSYKVARRESDLCDCYI